MARQNINVGATGNDKTGDPLRTAFTKTNSNFTELYNSVASISATIIIPIEYADILDAPTDISDLTDTTGILIPDPPTSLVNNSKEVELDAAGTLNVPYHTNDAFQITLSAANYVPTLLKPTLSLVGSPWSFNGEFTYSATGGTEFIVDDGPLPSSTNPGYGNGDAFTFNSTVHGIPNYILTITLSNVVNVGFVLWTADLTPGILPEYPSTIKSLSSIKLTAANNDLILGTDGSLTLPSGSPILFGNGNARIQSGMGFHIISEEGISIEAVNADDPLDITTKSWEFDVSGELILPLDGSVNQNGSYTRTSTDTIVSANTVIWVAHSNLVSGAKLFIQAESNEDGDATGLHSQVCEAIIASRGYVFSVPGPFGTPVMNIYGTTYTSVNELVTFTVQRNADTDLIEVVATASAESNGTVYLRIYSIETVTSD
jgi:hypothetical protein